jgi:hypothetical protein
VRRSDFRDGDAGELPHLGRIVDEDAENVTLPVVLGLIPGPESGAGNALHG